MGHMAGKTHPKTNIRYDENGFPEFNSDFDTYLPEDTLLSSREVHFNRCNKAIAETIEKDPEFAKKFTQDEIDQFKKGLTPKRFTWHHHQEVGKMQLVDYEIHRKTGHTGGYKIWGKDQYD